MSARFLQVATTVALALCAAGLLWRASGWLRRGIGADARGFAPLQRLRAVLATIAAAVASRRGLRVLGAFCLDALLLRRLFPEARLRAVAHLLLFAGFVMLVLTHALAPLVTARLFPGYQSTLEPWLSLRNTLGAVAVVGLAVLVVARARSRVRVGLPRRRFAGAFAALLACVLVSGFLLEATKIASPRAFDRMVGQFAATADAGDVASLRALWARDYGVAFERRMAATMPVDIEPGQRLHDQACAFCHAPPAGAFVSWPLARMIAPATATLDAVNAEGWLLYLHVIACLVGLATLPFTTFFHAVAAPCSLLLDAAARLRSAGDAALPGAARAVRRAFARDACVRCGLCDTQCSVAPVGRYLGNPWLLPAHKVVATAAMTGGHPLPSGDVGEPSTLERRRIADGAHLCTDCGRCTRACPVGLDLADLWRAGRDDLATAGLPATAAWVQARPATAWAEALATHGARPLPAASLPSDAGAFARCVQCQTCTNVCPVVAHGAGSGRDVDLTPQKVMNLLRLGLADLALGSRMVASCASCYQCQQHCPEGIRVADLMIGLRARAVARLGAVRESEGA